MLAKVIFAFLFFVAGIFGFAYAEAVTCDDLFPPVHKPCFFAIWDGNRCSYLLGYTPSHYPLSQLPEYVMEALSQSRRILFDYEMIHEGQIFDLELKPLRYPLEKPLDQQLTPALTTLYYQRLRSFSDLSAQLLTLPSETKLTASHLKRFHDERFESYYRWLSPDEAQKALETSAIPIMTQFKGPHLVEAFKIWQQVASGPTLSQQILGVAETASIAAEPIETLEMTKRYDASRRTLEHFKQVLQALALRRQIKLATPVYSQGDLNAYTREAIFSRQQTPKVFKHLISNRVWRWMPTLLYLHNNSAPLFITVDVHTLLTKDGLLHLLESEDFRIRRITSQAGWIRVQKQYARNQKFIW